MKLREMTQAELEKAYETDLKEAFPRSEEHTSELQSPM